MSLLEAEKQIQNKIPEKWVAAFICAIYTLVVFVHTFTGKGLIVGSNQSNSDLVTSWSASNWWNAMIVTGHYNFFLSKNGDITCCNIMSHVMGIFALIGYISRRILSLFCDLFDLMCILTLWTVTKEFCKSLDDSLQEKLELPITDSRFTIIKATSILKRFELLKQLASLINEGLGANLCAWVVETVLYYSLYFDAVLIEKSNNANILRVFSLFFYFGNACTILFFSAKIPYKMKTLKRWLSIEENRLKVKQDELTLILNEVDDNLVSIKGGNVYPLTFSTIANMLSIILTNFIVCLQF